MSTEAKQPHIVADNREPDELCDLLESMGAELELKQLSLGDYLLSDRLAVERKTRQDFESSILDGRLFSQLSGLAKAYPRVVLLVEGAADGESRISRAALLGAYSSVIADLGCTIFFTRSSAGTAELLIALATHEQFAANRAHPVYAKRKANSLSAQKRAIIEALPNVGPTLARALLKYFYTVENVITAPESELLEVEKIGEKKAKAIRQLLTRRYKEDEED